MWEMFVVGTVGFWLLIVAEIIVLSLCMEYETGILATVSLGVFLAALHFMGGVNILALLAANWWLVGIAVGCYLGFAVLWGFCKWVMFYHDWKEKYKEARYEWLKSQGVENPNILPDEMKPAWLAWLENHKEYNSTAGRHIRLGETPQARENKARIIRWMAYWPISLLLFLFRDLVVRTFKKIYNSLASTLQHMADRAFEDIKGDFEGVKAARATAKRPETGNGIKERDWDR